jgi:hypothetical protein
LRHNFETHFLGYRNLLIFTYARQKEDPRIVKCLRIMSWSVFGALFDHFPYFVLHNGNYLHVSKAWLEEGILYAVQRDESFLGTDVLTWLRVVEEFAKNLEETFGVKVQEPLHKLVVGAEANNIVHVKTPLVATKTALRKFLPLEEKRDYPEQFVPDVSGTAFDL